MRGGGGVYTLRPTPRARTPKREADWFTVTHALMGLSGLLLMASTGLSIAALTVSLTHSGPTGSQGDTGSTGSIGDRGTAGTDAPDTGYMWYLKSGADFTVDLPSTDTWTKLNNNGALPAFTAVTLNRGGMFALDAFDNLTISVAGFYEVKLLVCFDQTAGTSQRNYQFSIGRNIVFNTVHELTSGTVERTTAETLSALNGMPSDHITGPFPVTEIRGDGQETFAYLHTLLQVTASDVFTILCRCRDGSTDFNLIGVDVNFRQILA